MAVVDASVYVALCNAQEDQHEVCWDWYRQCLEGGKPLRAPNLLLSEVAAALSRGLGDQILASRVVDHLISSQEVELMPVGLSIAESAARIAAEYRIRGADAIYVALAKYLGDELVTLDRQQRERSAAIIDTGKPSVPGKSSAKAQA